MHDVDTKSLALRANTANTFILSPNSEFVTQIVVNCSNAGTTFALSVKDAGTPARTWFGPATMALSNTGPIVTKFNSPIRFNDGVVATTTGTPGILDLAVSVIHTKAR